jgi:hypothetical protein
VVQGIQRYNSPAAYVMVPMCPKGARSHHDRACPDFLAVCLRKSPDDRPEAEELLKVVFTTPGVLCVCGCIKLTTLLYIDINSIRS